jgi:hypothetical protein
MSRKRASLSLGAPLGNLEGIRLLGLFLEKSIVYPSSFLDQEDIKLSILGAIWNFGKGTGLH